MKEQNKAIKVLLSVIILLIIILVLKMTNIIKPVEKRIVDDTKETEESNITIEQKIDNEADEERLNKLFNFMAIFGSFAIAIQIASIIIWIGEGKLYKKIGMPDWTIVLAYIYPFITILSGYLPETIGNFIEGIVGIFMLITLCNYFKSVGMSRWWPVLAVVSILILSYSVALIISSNMTSALMRITGETKTTPASAIIFSVLSGLGILIFIIQYAISNYRLAEEFGKGTGFKIGMVILPFIFRPILGFQRD